MSQTEDAHLAPGSVFDGRYEVLEEIGGGSFGRVYRARQRSTGQLVALKLQRSPESLPPDARERLRERFLRETGLCAELSHPNVVRLLDSAEPDGQQAYAVFEYVPGSTLARLLAEQDPPAPREAARLMIQVLDALSAAHRLGIVHRDLKTENVMVSGTGALRNAHVLDFGLGGFVEERRAAERRVTLSREFLGTPLYASPEQLRGEPASPRSDLYAWGLILLECLTGEHAFEGEAALGLRFSRDGAVEVALPEPLRGHPLGDLLARVTASDPARRDLEPAEIVRVLEGIDWDDLASRLVRPSKLAAPRGARRQVTIVSCRVQAPAELGFEAHHALHRRFYALCAEAAGHHGGQVSSTLGDRVLLHFGFPVGHESDARRAARAALEIVERAARQPAPEGSDAAPLVPHLGIHTGPVVARDTRGAGRPDELDLAGATAELAAKLDALAGPGEILLGETTRRLLRGTLGAAPLGESVAGLARPLEVHRLEPGAPEADADAAPSPLVGRELELRQLRDELSGAIEGRPRCVAITGEPGIGKSRLVRELRRTGPELRWLACRCLEDTQDTPLQPAIALLRVLGAPTPELLARYGLEPATYTSLFERLLGAPDPETASRPQLSPDREKFLLCDGLTRLLLGLAREAPAAILFEDVHWADPTTRELLADVISRIELADEPIHLLVLLTSRDWAPTGASTRHLKRLTRSEIRDLVAAAPAVAETLGEDVLEGIVEKSDGVPLFVEEVMRAVAEQQRAGGRDAAGRPEIEVPAELEALLQARLDTLSEQARATTQLGAAIGRDFSYALLKAASGASDPELAEDLGELTRGGFVVLRPSAAGETYRFRHAMIRDAAYQTMLSDARQERHARIASLLEGAFAEISQRQPALLARHLEGAGERLRAAAAWRDAGRSALAQGGYVEAIRQLERGDALLAGAPEGPERERLAFELTGSLGNALIATQGYAAPQVQQTFARASELCDRLGEDLPLDVLYGLWSVQLVRGEVDATAALVPRFESLAESGDALEQMTARAVVGLRALLLGELESADDALAQAVEILERPGNLDLLKEMPYSGAVYPLAWRTLLQLYRGDPARAIRGRDELDQIAQRLGDPYGLAVAGHFSALLARDLGDVKGALARAERQIAHASEQKILLWQCSSQCIRGWARAHSGDAPGADELAANVGVLRGIGLVTTLPTLLAFQAEAELAAGRTDAAAATIDEARGLCDRILDRYYLAEILRIRGRALQAAGDDAGSRERFAEAIGIAQRQGSPWFAMRAATDLAAVDPEQAREPLAAALSAITGGEETEPVAQARRALARAGRR